MKSKEYRKWEKPRAERQYERDCAKKQREHNALVAGFVDDIVNALTNAKQNRVQEYGRDVLLLHLAKLANMRLYDSGIDSKLKGHARLRQGDRYRAMNDALRHVVETREDVTLTVDRDSQLHTLQLVQSVTSVQQQVIQEDGQVLLLDTHRAQLRKWKEPDMQFV